MQVLALTVIEVDTCRSRVNFWRFVMFRLSRRAARLSGVQFCDSCAEVTTAAERARLHRDRVVSHALGQLWPR
jgi:hypothetical protein